MANISEFSKVVQKACTAFKTGLTKNVDFRMNQLKSLLQMLSENEQSFCEAVCQDTGKPYQESALFEVEFLLNDIRCMIHNLRKWNEPASVEKNFITLLDEAIIKNEPYGVVLVIGAWNYPLQLSMSPVVGAIAAGNCVILKPSEMAPKTAKLMQELVEKYLDNECYQVVQGGPEETSTLLKEKFDYIFYTGSTRVGKIVRDAANVHLTPVTLELGGKSPVYIDDTVNFEVACRRLLWGKLINAGQTCVAPDYMLCTKDVQQRLLPVLKNTLKDYYGEDPKLSPDLGRIINEKHFHRLLSLMKRGTIEIGGTHDESIRYIAPTIITNVHSSDPIMQEEIFGPILPIITVTGPDEAIDIINSKEKALTLNVFSKNSKIVRKFLDYTSSGSVCVNDSVVNLSIETLPFGGVGKSGIGRYHGKYSFETFSHAKGILIKNYSMLGEKLGEARYPPYSKSNERYLKKLMKRRPDIMPRYAGHMLFFAIGFIAAFIIKAILHFSGISYF